MSPRRIVSFVLLSPISHSCCVCVWGLLTTAVSRPGDWMYIHGFLASPLILRRLLTVSIFTQNPPRPLLYNSLSATSIIHDHGVSDKFISSYINNENSSRPYRTSSRPVLPVTQVRVSSLPGTFVSLELHQHGSIALGANSNQTKTEI